MHRSLLLSGDLATVMSPVMTKMPVTIVVGFRAGGSSNSMAQFLVTQLKKILARQLSLPIEEEPMANLRIGGVAG